MQGSPLDPSASGGFIHTKIGMDATKPLKDLEKFERISIPKHCEGMAEEILKKYL